MGIDEQLNRYSELNSELECQLLNFLQPSNQTEQESPCISGDPLKFSKYYDQANEKSNYPPSQDVPNIDNLILNQDNFLNEYSNVSERSNLQCSIDALRYDGNTLQSGVDTLSPLIESDEMPDSIWSSSTAVDSKSSEVGTFKNLVWVDQLSIFAAYER